MQAYNSSLLETLLPDYYKNIFPFKSYCKWLTYNKKSTEYFNRREFAFIFEGDVHFRYRSYEQPTEFEKDLCDRHPQKLDLGAVYNHCPKDNKKFSDFKAVERELVFDIDLTDYDVVRTCCSEAKVCQKCWKFVVAAVMVLDRALDEDFGFKARMWVFSGRRGVHCWVGDEIARRLNNTGRASVAEYLSLIQAEKLGIHTSKAKNRAVHPLIEQSYRSLMDSGLIDEMVKEQQWLENDNYENVFNKIEDVEIRTEVLGQLKEMSPTLRWKYLKGVFDENTRLQNEEIGTKVSEKLKNLGYDKDFLKWFVLFHVYPRLDVNVSTGVNHLLKSPFCIHPKTGNVAVPLDPSKIRYFEVSECPRIDVLIKELQNALKTEEVKENRKLLGYKHTSLADYVENFDRFVNLAIIS